MKRTKEGTFRRQSGKGFTLVEMIVTIAVLGILLAASAAGLMAWQRNSIYKKNNEYAQTLFMAAQSALTHEAAAGNLTELNSALQTNSHSGRVNKDESGTDALRQLYYMDIYLSDYDSLDTEGNLLYGLLKNYVYDKTIFQAAIRLELDPTDGTVYSVSYTDRANKFEYSEADGSNGAMGINNEVRTDESLRRKRLMGYYDTTLSEEAPPGNYARPVISRAVLYNEEQLTLGFTLASQYRIYWQMYTYQAALYDDTDTKRAEISLDAGALTDDDNDPDTWHSAQVSVVLYDKDGKASEAEEYTTAVTVKKDGEMCILLDGVDLGAASVLDAALLANTGGTAGTGSLLKPDSYADTNSILRWCRTEDTGSGLAADTSVIYARVNASLESYTGRQAVSNKENPFLGEKKNSSDGFACTVENARHLFNLRFTEILYASEDTVPEKTGVSYTQKADCVWSGEDGLVAEGFLYQGCQKIKPDAVYTAGDGNGEAVGENSEYLPFPAIPYLGENSSFLAGSSLLGKRWEIKNLTLREENESSLTADPAKSAAETYALGLFRVNRGSVETVILRDVCVDGQNYTGALCGINKGLINDVQVLGEAASASAGTEELSGARGYVRGKACVGGIAGCHAAVSTGQALGQESGYGSYQNLTNEADVYGKIYVGGILGTDRMVSEQETAVITGISLVKCSNKGIVEVDSEYADDPASSTPAGTPGSEGTTELQKVTCGYVGGIAGALTGGKVTECTSRMGSRSAVDRLGSRSFLDESEFYGSYVGGIAGYCRNTGISECSTGGGMVTGRSYVGGIVGKYDAADGTESSLEGENKSNRADVIGYEYVGGIAGTNGKDQTISGWKNQGIVLASYGYAGGITGYNEGSIKNCSSTVDSSRYQTEEISALSRSLRSPSSLGYVGGIAGYSSGTITTDPKMEVTCILDGASYVGGLVGYLDVDGILEGYALTGGYITGDSFVGGAVGLNASAKLFAQEETAAGQKQMSIEPNQVSGRAFVGGLTGGTILPEAGTQTAGTENTLYMKCEINNSFGKVQGVSGVSGSAENGICVGGIIGFYQVLGSAQDSQTEPAQAAESGREQVKKAGESLARLVSDGWKDGVWNYQAVLEELEEISAGEGAASSGNLTLSITDSSVRLNEVSGGLYIGGMVGFCDDASRLVIVDGVSKSRVRSTCFIVSEDKSCLKTVNGAYALANYRYMADEGETADTGAAGTLENGRITSDGDRVNYSYTGGILGYVGRNAELVRCSVEDTVTTADGVTYHGQLAEVNAGTIRECKAGSAGDGTTSFIGGIAGRNTETGKIYDCTVSGTITARAAAGGIAAENYGLISASTESQNASSKVLDADGKIVVSEICAGGVAGFNAGTIKDYKVCQSMTGTASYTGGIAGISLGDVTNVDMKSGLAITGKSYVGGYIGYMCNVWPSNVKASIAFGGSEAAPVVNSAEVTAQGVTDGGQNLGNAGGIIGYIETGKNTGAGECGTVQVSYCENRGKVTAQAGNAGGITAWNTGTIINCGNFSDVISRKGICGGIAAVNYGTDSVVKECKIQEKTEIFSSKITLNGAVYAGGIAGWNQGIILSCQAENLKVTNEASTSAGSLLGGIAGLNDATGSIGVDSRGESSGENDGENATENSGISVGSSGENVEIAAYTSNSSVGGVAGENRGVIQGKSGGSQVYAQITWSSSGLTGWLGGAVGRNTAGNGYRGKVSGLLVRGSIKGYGGSSGGFGGVAGQSDGDITNCDFSGEVTGTGSAGDMVNVGGIAGRVGNGGIVKQCTVAQYKDTKIQVSNNNSGNGCAGGIAGRCDGTVEEIYYSDSMPSEHTLTVSTEMGNAGGLIGYLGTSGKVQNSSTGGELAGTSTGVWEVKGTVKQTDDGTGGIVGYSCSDNDMVNLTNYAAVTRTVGGSNGVGGIVGRIETKNNSSRRISGCKNYGSVTGAARVGGIVGVMKFKGGIITGCTNEGTITMTGGEDGAGGILGQLYQMDANETLELSDCVNFANVVSNYNRPIGGIFGNDNNSTEAGGTTVRLVNCVNTGNICSNQGAGIYGYHRKSYKVQLIQCRNYGYGKDNRIDTISGLIYATGGGKILMQDCYGVANLKTPVTGMDEDYLDENCKRNYYFTETPDDEAKNEIRMNLAFSGSGEIMESGYAYKAVDYNSATRFIAKSNGGSQPMALTVTFLNSDGSEATVKTDGMNIAWYGENTRKWYYEIEITYLEEGEEKTVELLNPDNGKEWCSPGAGKNSGTDITSQTDEGIQVDFKKAENYEEIKDKDISAIKIIYKENTVSKAYFTIWDLNVNDLPRPTGVYSLKGTELLVEKKSEEEGKYTAKLQGSNVFYLEKLSENPCTTTKTPKELFECIDEELRQGNLAERKLVAPTGLAIEPGNPYEISWNAVRGAYAYSVAVEILSSESGTEPIANMDISVPYGTTAQLPVETSWGGCTMKVKVKAISAYGEEYHSDYSETKECTLIPPLPTPEAHLERLYDSTGEYMTVCIDNIADYVQDGEFLEGIGIQVRLNNTIQKTWELTDSNFDPVTGQGKGKWTEGGTESANAMVQFQLLSNDPTKWMDSGTVSYQTTPFKDSLLTDKATAGSRIIPDKETAESYLTTGTTGSPDNLGYTVFLKGTGYEVYYKTDLVMYDENIGTDVVVSSIQTRVVGDSTNWVSAAISGIPEDIKETFRKSANPSLTVRSYLWAGQGYAVYFGRKDPLNERPMNAEEIREFGGKEGYITGAGTTEAPYTVANGYILERVSAENESQEILYNIYYSTMLAAENGERYKNQYTKETIEFTNRQPQPAIEKNYKDENDTYIFTWDEGKTGTDYTNALYQVKAIAIDESGNESTVADIGSTAERSLEIPSSNWNYKSLRLEVTRLGTSKTVDGISVADKLFNYAEETYTTKRKLPQITGVDLKLTGDNRDELKYDITWNPVTAAAALGELEKYQVYAQVPFAEENDEEKAAEEAGYEKAFGENSVSRYQAENGTEAGFLILLGESSRNGDEAPEASLEACDLEALAGKTIELFVNARAKEDAENYADSTEGVHKTGIEIPERKNLPGKMEFAMKLLDENDNEISQDKAVDVEVFRDMSVCVQVTAEGTDSDKGGYKFQTGIYEQTYKKNEETKDIVVKANGTWTVNPEALEDGALKEEIPTAWPDKTVESGRVAGLLKNTTYTFREAGAGNDGWSEEYAGKFLIVRCRAASDSEISSDWSDYQVFQLPDGRLQTPQITGTDETESGTLGTVTYSRNSIPWTGEAYVDSYRLTLTELAGKESILEIKLPQEDTGEPVVEWKGTGTESTVMPSSSATTETGWTYKIDGYKYEFKVNESDENTNSSSLELEITRSSSGVWSFKLILPDISELTWDGTTSQYLYTQSVSIQAVAADASSYESSGFRIWVRTKRGDTEKPEQLLLERTADSEENLEELIKGKDSELSLYPVQEAALPLKIILSEAEGRSARSTVSGNSVSGNSVSGNSIPEDTQGEEEKDTGKDTGKDSGGTVSGNQPGKEESAGSGGTAGGETESKETESIGTGSTEAESTETESTETGSRETEHTKTENTEIESTGSKETESAAEGEGEETNEE